MSSNFRLTNKKIKTRKMKKYQQKNIVTCTACLLIALFPNIAIAQNAGCDSINWSKTRKLTWNDFKATPDTLTNFGTVSRINIGYKWTTGDDCTNVRISCYFRPCDSWTRIKSDTDLTLSHEQTHFDIAEYFRRLFVQKVSEYDFTKKTFAADIRKIYANILAQKDLMTKTYETETDFHRNPDQQVSWNQKMPGKIDSLQVYDMPIVKLKLTR